MMIKIKRIYEAVDTKDGFRVLVDRLWPRGLSKEKAHVDLWVKEIAPSNELRKWFHHDPWMWDEFVRRYRKELSSKKDLIKQLHELEEKYKTITLLYGARDREHNQAVVLEKLIT